MFQNISSKDMEGQEIKQEQKDSVKEILHRLFAKQNIILYTISFLISMDWIKFRECYFFNSSIWT